MVGVQHEQHIHRPHQHRIDLAVSLSGETHHVEKVGAVVEPRARVGTWSAEPVLVGEGERGRQLAENAPDLVQAVIDVVDLLGLRVECGHRRDRADEDAHRMRAGLEGLEYIDQVFVDLRMRHDARGPVAQLAGCGQFAEEQKVGHLEKGALFRQLFNRIAPVPQNTPVAVDKGDAALAGRCIRIAWIVGQHAKVIGLHLELAQADGRDRVMFDRQLCRLTGTVIGNR